MHGGTKFLQCDWVVLKQNNWSLWPRQQGSRTAEGSDLATLSVDLNKMRARRSRNPSPSPASSLTGHHAAVHVAGGPSGHPPFDYLGDQIHADSHDAGHQKPGKGERHLEARGSH